MARTHIWFLGIVFLTTSIGTHSGLASCLDGEEACEESDDVALMQSRVREHVDVASVVDDNVDHDSKVPVTVGSVALPKRPSSEILGEVSPSHRLVPANFSPVAFDETDAVVTVSEQKALDSQPVFGQPVPWMHVNISLDLKPRERFKEFTRQRKHAIHGLYTHMWASIAQKFAPHVIEEWWQAVRGKFPDFEEEVAGQVDVFKENGTTTSLTVKHLFLLNMVYELGSPTLGKGCSGVIAQLADGSIVHGRNLDYIMPYDSTQVNYQMTFYRNQKPVFVNVGALTAVSTGMRFGGWSFEQNTREPLDPALNLKHAKSGALPFAFVVRQIMETTPDYSEALRKMESTRFIAGQYFVLTGTKPNEGAVFAVDANITHALPYTTTLSLQSSIGRWFLIQTNDDQWNWPSDPRRPLAYARMNKLNQTDVTFGEVEKIMTTYPLFDALTIMTWVCNVKQGTHQLIAHPKITAYQGAAAAAGLIPGR